MLEKYFENPREFGLFASWSPPDCAYSHDLKMLNPLFREIIDPFLTQLEILYPRLKKRAALPGQDIAFDIRYTYRSPGFQNRLLSKKHRVTRAGSYKSAHNYGLAVDIYPFRWNPHRSKWEFVTTYHEAAEFFDVLGELCENFGLVWGGNWTKFPDFYHVQSPLFNRIGWKKLALFFYGVKIC